MQSSTKNQKGKKVAAGGVFAALALIFSYVEMLIPFNFGVPGIKLGIANLVVVAALYLLGPAFAFAINLTRIALAALLFGNLYSAVYALSGALLSFGVMLALYALKTTKKSPCGKEYKESIFSPLGVSAAGGFFHNLGQLLMAMAVTAAKDLMYYFPVLAISGIITGLLNGVLVSLILGSISRSRL